MIVVFSVQSKMFFCFPILMASMALANGMDNYRIEIDILKQDIKKLGLCHLRDDVIRLKVVGLDQLKLTNNTSVKNELTSIVTLLDELKLKQDSECK